MSLPEFAAATRAYLAAGHFEVDLRQAAVISGLDLTMLLTSDTQVSGEILHSADLPGIFRGEAAGFYVAPDTLRRHFIIGDEYLRVEESYRMVIAAHEIRHAEQFQILSDTLGGDAAAKQQQLLWRETGMNRIGGLVAAFFEVDAQWHALRRVKSGSILSIDAEFQGQEYLRREVRNCRVRRGGGVEVPDLIPNCYIETAEWLRQNGIF